MPSIARILRNRTKIDFFVQRSSSLRNRKEGFYYPTFIIAPRSFVEFNQPVVRHSRNVSANLDIPFRNARREIIIKASHLRALCLGKFKRIARARARVWDLVRDSHVRPFARHLSIKRSSAFASARRGERKYRRRKYYLHARRGRFRNSGATS